MGYKVFYTKDFNGCLRSIERSGRRDVLRKVRAAMTEAQTNGSISDLSRTHHGESRLPSAEKYDLGSGHRLVVQLVDGVQKARAFLFAGDHEDAERWLEGHRNYRWVESEKDKTLQFVQVSDVAEPLHVPAERLDLESPESLLSLSLLRSLTDAEWSALPFDDDTRSYLRSVTALDYERDADGILEYVAGTTTYENAALAVDLLHHAHAREFDQLAQRVRLACGEARSPSAAETVRLMEAPENSEVVITFDDDVPLGELLEKGALSDWMLFLHQEQRRVAFRDFNGPVRLRGVSGSGKTSVLVHRARYLARKHGLPVLVVTLTESMRKLLEVLVRELCGVEQQLIDVLTLSQLAKQVIEQEHERGLRGFLLASNAQLDGALTAAEQACRSEPAFATSQFASWERATFRSFLKDEIQYVRSRLLPEHFDMYLDTKAFKRRGRGGALNEQGRRICLVGVRAWETRLASSGVLDNEGVTSLAATLLLEANHTFRRYRCAVADEVQDLSQVDLAILSNLNSPHGASLATAENGLFLVGDGAQTIYRRGFTLQAAGIAVAGRSFLLRKNYRNTYEILRAAYALIERFEFADADDDDFAGPSAPDYAKRRGERPRLVKCSTLQDEVELVAADIVRSIQDGARPAQICVIGATPFARSLVQRSLASRDVPTAELREDVGFDSDNVKISTIESAKGHEFASVYVLGLVEGVLPHAGAEEAEMAREAARLYVAMTRARDALWLSYNTQRDGPSRFLLPVQPFCDELEFTRGGLRPVLSMVAETSLAR